MITPKDKSKELLDKFINYGLIDKYMGISSSKQCCLILINEILQELSLYNDEHDCTDIQERINYYYEVRKELEK